jgi:hypothetical protein
LAAALQAEFGELGELTLRLESPMPADWWLGCTLISEHALLGLGTHRAQLTFWNITSERRTRTLDAWRRVENLVTQCGAPLSRRELEFHGHFPVTSERFGSTRRTRPGIPFGEVEFEGQVLHFRPAPGAQGKLLLDRSEQMDSALYLWVQASWPDVSASVETVVAEFAVLVLKAMQWAKLGEADGQ